MLSHCANSRCAKPFLRLHEGRLFQVDNRHGKKSSSVSEGFERVSPKPVERYWLCPECSAMWTLAWDIHRGIMLIPRSKPSAAEESESIGEVPA